MHTTVLIIDNFNKTKSLPITLALVVHLYKNIKV